MILYDIFRFCFLVLTYFHSCYKNMLLTAGHRVQDMLRKRNRYIAWLQYNAALYYVKIILTKQEFASLVAARCAYKMSKEDLLHDKSGIWCITECYYYTV